MLENGSGSARNAPPLVLAIVGRCRKGGIVDRAIDEVLSAAREEGAETGKIYLIGKRIEYCTNCSLRKGFEGFSFWFSTPGGAIMKESKRGRELGFGARLIIQANPLDSPACPSVC